VTSSTGRLSAVIGFFLVTVRNLAIAGFALAAGLGLGYMLAFKATTWPITVIGISLYLLVIIASPLAGLLLWIVTAPFSRFVYLDVILGRGIPDLTLTRICAGVLLVVALAQLSIGRRRGARPILLDGIVLAVLLGIGATTPASLDGFKSAITNFGDTYLVPAIIYFLARLLIRRRQDVEALCTAFVLLGTILTSVALQEQVTGVSLFLYSERSWVYTKDIHRLAGLLGSPAFFAVLITVGAGFAIYRFIHGKTLESRMLHGVLAGYMVLGVFLTYNRAGWLALALNLLIMAVAWPSFRRLFIALLLVGVVAVTLSWKTVSSSAVVTQRLEAQGPITYRLEIWSHAAVIFAHNPLFGLGYSNFGQAYLRYNPAWTRGVVLPAPHNTLLEVLFDNGLIGALPYIAMLAAILAGIVRFYRRARDRTEEAPLILAFGLAALAYVVQAMAVDMISGYYVNMVLMLAVGGLFGWQNEEINARRDPGAIPDRSQ
jgi:O-antigen ligase